MKKFLSIFCGTLLLIASLLTVTACGHCEHYNKEKISDTATCEAAGIITYHCNDCNEDITETSSAIGHDYSIFVSDSATCLAAGKVTNKCSRCNSTNEVASEKKSHSYNPIKCETCGSIKPDYEAVVIRYSSGTYTYRKEFTRIVGYTIYKLDCSITFTEGSKTAKLFIMGSMSAFTSHSFMAWIYDESTYIGNGGIILTTANKYSASREISLSRAIQANETCFLQISHLDLN